MRVSKRILALVLALVMVFGLFTTASARNFNDVPDADTVSPEHLAAVGTLYGMNILRGHGPGEYEGLFTPQRPVLRSEMTAILFRLTIDADDDAHPPAPGGGRQVFSDVPPAHWAFNYIYWAQNAGLVVGDAGFGGPFRPDDNINVIEAAVMILRTLGYDELQEFQGADWAVNAYRIAVQIGLFAQIDGLINYEVGVTTTATREMIAQMIFNIMDRPFVEWHEAAQNYRERELDGGTHGDRFGFTRAANPVGGVSMVMGLADPVTTLTPVAPAMPRPTVDTLRTNVLPVAANFGNPEDVGRVFSTYVANQWANQVYFPHKLSTDFAVEALTGRVAALEELREEFGEDLNVANVAVFQNFEQIGNINLGTGVWIGAEGFAGLFDMPLTYVYWAGQIVSIVFHTRWVMDLDVTRLGLDFNVFLDDVPASLTGTTTINEATGAYTEKRIVNNSSVALDEAINTWVNVELVGNTFVLTDVETFTANITEYDIRMVDGTMVRGTFVADDGRWVYVPGVSLPNGPSIWEDHAEFPVEGGDLNNLSMNLDAHNMHPNFMTQALLNDFATEFTFYISGVTGHIIAITLDAPPVQIAYIIEIGYIWTGPFNRDQEFWAEVIWATGEKEVIALTQGENDLNDLFDGIGEWEGDRGFINEVHWMAGDEDAGFEILEHRTVEDDVEMNTMRHNVNIGWNDNNTVWIYIDNDGECEERSNFSGHTVRIGPHVNEIESGVELYFVRAGIAADNALQDDGGMDPLTVVFVMDTLVDTGATFFFPGPFRVNPPAADDPDRRPVFTYQAYCITTGEALEVTAREQVVGVNWDHVIDPAMNLVPRGFYTLGLDEAYPASFAPRTDFEENMYFVDGPDDDPMGESDWGESVVLDARNWSYPRAFALTLNNVDGTFSPFSTEFAFGNRDTTVIVDLRGPGRGVIIEPDYRFFVPGMVIAYTAFGEEAGDVMMETFGIIFILPPRADLTEAAKVLAANFDPAVFTAFSWAAFAEEIWSSGLGDFDAVEQLMDIIDIDTGEFRPAANGLTQAQVDGLLAALEELQVFQDLVRIDGLQAALADALAAGVLLGDPAVTGAQEILANALIPTSNIPGSEVADAIAALLAAIAAL